MARQSNVESKFNQRARLPDIPRLQAEFAACTIIAKNYLAMARVLANSFQRCNPGCPFFVLLMDPVEGSFIPHQEAFHLLEARQLPIANLEGFLFKYGVMEASTAVKPTFLKKLLRDHDIRKLIYLDPDILVLQSLKELSGLLDENPIVLTPHITSPYMDDAIPREHDILRAGTFNLGFIGLQSCPMTDQLLHWWERKLYHYGLLDFEKNMFVDQRWMDMAPSLFDVKILREPGYNVAYWNLHDKHITTVDGQLRVNGKLCYFFHFSGFNPLEPSLVSKHQTRFKMSKLGDLRSLFAEYRDLLLTNGWEQASKWPYTYNYFDSGVPIPDSARRFYWSLGEDVRNLGDPFTWIAHPTNSKGEILPPHSKPPEYPFGINVIGYVASEKGVGEAVRSNIRIMASSGIPYVCNNFVDTGSKNLESLPSRFSRSNPYKLNLINVNADQVPFFVQRNNGYLRDRYNIGYWAWELPSFPTEWRGSFAYVDEVWVPSKFTQQSVAEASPRPVLCVPHSIDPEIKASPEWTRDRLRIPPETFVYLFLFDFHSFLERKNPIGLIRAFREAFGNRKDVLLLMKSVHAESDALALRKLQAEIEWANVRIFDEVLSRQAIHGLMQLADCYVSLHRSEGFGLTLAEAMMCGKPVIATGYSGNIDFMHPNNSFLVPYRLIEIDQDHGPYKRGNLWADPDLHQASELMKLVLEDRKTAHDVAINGQKHVLTALHPKSIAEIVKSRVTELGWTIEPSFATR